MTGPLVKGWCPGAYRPMASGDGLLVRIRPHLARLTRAQVLAFCAAAQQFGNGLIDLTSRANLQIRGVAQNDLEALLNAMAETDLLDADAKTEARRNILTTPLWQQGDLTEKLHAHLLENLSRLPDLPAKMGVVLDTSREAVLQDASGDFRFEQSEAGDLMLRADGAKTGWLIAPDQAIDALRDLAHWFLESGGAKAGRMARHLSSVDLPKRFTGSAPARRAAVPRPGHASEKLAYGVRFGQMQAADLADLVTQSEAKALRFSPWRMLFLEEAQPVAHAAFTLDPDDPALRVHACPGAPACTQGLAPTRALAAHLAARMPAQRHLHVSGCAKGCAHPKAADVTLVAEKAGFNLVTAGCAWDEPARRNLALSEIEDLLRH